MIRTKVFSCMVLNMVFILLMMMHVSPMWIAIIILRPDLEVLCIRKHLIKLGRKLYHLRQSASPMAIIPKPDGDVRLIHDCSRPAGMAVNNNCSSNWHQKFSWVGNAVSLMTPGCYKAKVDLKSCIQEC